MLPGPAELGFLEHSRLTHRVPGRDGRVMAVLAARAFAGDGTPTVCGIIQGLALAHSQQPTPTQIADVNIHGCKQISMSDT